MTSRRADEDLQFVFDAGVTARLYLPDVSTRNLLAIYEACPGRIHAPSLVLGEITAAWLAAVRAKLLTADEYRALKEAFLDDVRNEVIVVWSDDTLHNAVVDVQERNSSVLGRQIAVNMGADGEDRLAVPRLETSDAYYVALAQVLHAARPDQRTIFVTNDNAAWTSAFALGLEVFHGRTCDLGIGRRHVGAPGAVFPAGRNCAPCQLVGCPSTFEVDLRTPAPHLGSGVPRQIRRPA